MNDATAGAANVATALRPRRAVVIAVLGLTQILAWGSSYYLPAVLAAPIAASTGWSLAWVVGGLSLGLLVAGLVAPRVGRIIDRSGGRPVLTASSVLLALGLGCLAVAQHLGVYLVAWIVLGLGMAAGLYDAAFATLGRLYGETARTAISSLTLWGGFASTACWPLSAFLVSSIGWREACLIYAALHLAVGLPMHLVLLPRAPALPGPSGERGADRPRAAQAAAFKVWQSGRELVLLGLVAAIVTTMAVISSVLSVQLIVILQALGVGLAAAVGFGALVGPSQVGARVVEVTVGRRFHPIWTALTAALLMIAGMGVLALGVPAIALGLILYGAANGIRSIVQGTLPLALFGAQGYAVRVGWLARPSLLAQAIAPTIAAYILDHGGAPRVLAILLALALFNVGLVGALWLSSSRAPALE